MDVDIRPIGPEGFDDMARLDAVSFGEPFDQRSADLHRPLINLDRSLGAFDGPDLVGAACLSDRELTVPGAVVPLAAVVAVVVAPTHRRRGLLTGLMRRQLDELRGQEPVAALWASEAAIYQRYGYGLGTLGGRFEIDRRHADLPRATRPEGNIRLVPRDEATKTFPAVYERIRPTRPGMLDRTEEWWRELMTDHGQASGHAATAYAVYESPDGPEGYVHYRTKPSSGAEVEGVLEIEELVAATSDAYTALWRYCLTMDLFPKVTGWKRPVDEPLLHMLVEPRRLRFTWHDGIWVRLVDLPRALEARRYSTEGKVTLEIRDAFCPWNEGRFALEGGPEGATCRRSENDPDLILDAADAASIYLGGVSLHTLVSAGRVIEASPGAARRGDALVGWHIPPWSVHVF